MPSVSQINPCSSVSLLQRIARRVKRPFNKASCTKNTGAHDTSLGWMNMQYNMDLLQLQNDFKSMVAKRQGSVKKYLKEKNYAAPEIEDYDMVGRNTKSLCLKNYVQLYENDLDLIYRYLGAYGLAQYAYIDPTSLELPCIQKELTGENICEMEPIGWQSVKENLGSYLYVNDKGFVDDIYLRFGQAGRDEFDLALITGTVAPTIYVDNNKFIATYHLTGKGKFMYRP